MLWNKNDLHANVYGVISSVKVVFTTLWESVKAKEFYCPLILLS